MAFDEIQFPVDISYGSSASPSYKTDVVILESGHESRAALLEFPRYVYDVSYGVKTKEQLTNLHAFFHGRKGRFRGFRFKDHFDFTATDTPLVVTGSRTIQLTKRYISGSEILNRVIRKPIDPITMRRNGGAFVAFSLNDTTGIITLTPDATSSIASGDGGAITGITNANPGVITTGVSHNLTTGDYVIPTGAGGMTEVNGNQYQVTVLTGTTFEIGVDTTSFGTYTSGGTVLNVGVSLSNPGVIRSVAHGLSTNDIVYLTGINGTVELNGNIYTVTVIDADHFSIGIDTSTFTAYTNAGSVESHVQPSETLDWSGQFDVPVRFDVDAIPTVHEGFDIGGISSIPLTEVLND